LLTEYYTAILKINLPFLFSQINNQPTMDPEIEVVAVTPAPEPEPAEVCPVKGACPICTFDFEDGEKVVVMHCDGRHILHSDCYEAMAEDDKKHQGETYAHTLVEAIRRHEGASKCPVCRQMSHCAVEAVAMIFYSGKTADDAIPIKDDDAMAEADVVHPHPGRALWLEQQQGHSPNVWGAFEDDEDEDDEEWFDAEG
jgi:hypothetical protein